MKILSLIKIIGGIIIIVFAGIGAAFTFVFFGMQHGVLNVSGTIAERNASFGLVPTTTKQVLSETNGCSNNDGANPCEWMETAQWEVVKGGLEKDAAIIQRVAEETGVPARMIAAAVIPEQMRFFSDNREVFKRYFEPLKILASLSQFSLGVSGIKQETAGKIEEYANSTSSPFYPGDNIAPLLAYDDSITDKSHALFNRLTNEDDHYYSYLYTAIFLKQITAQWEKAGFDVTKRPDVLVTLFNLGFQASVPKPDPKVAGAAITVGGQKYSFGYLGTLFYESDQLTDIFSKP